MWAEAIPIWQGTRCDSWYWDWCNRWQLPLSWKGGRCGCQLITDWWQSLKILSKIICWGYKWVPDLHSTEVLADLNPWKVQTIADQPLDVYKIASSQIRLQVDVKLCVIDRSNQFQGNHPGTCQNSMMMPLGKIWSLETKLLGMVPWLIVLWQHVLGKYADQMIDLPILLCLKPDWFKNMMISTIWLDSDSDQTKWINLPFKQHVCVDFLIDRLWFLAYSRPHTVWTIRTHCLEQYSTKLWGKAGLLEILSKISLNSARSEVWTSFLTKAHSSRNWSVRKCNRIAYNTCHMHKSTWLSGYTASSAVIWAWSQSVMM